MTTKDKIDLHQAGIDIKDYMACEAKVHRLVMIEKNRTQQMLGNIVRRLR